MKFNRRAKIDSGQIDDRRGQRSGGSGLRLPGGIGGGGAGGSIGRAGIGGGVGLVIAVIALLIFIVPQFTGGGEDTSNSSPADLSQCSSGTGEPTLDCRIGYDVTSIQDFWAQSLQQQTGTPYSKARIVWFTGATDSGCGQASSGMGPFYCPTDRQVYLDPSFFHDMLQGQLGATGGDLAEAYVVAHEYGHHVQDLLGTMSKVGSGTGATSGSVRLELQADCYAGVWVHHASTVNDPSTGEPFITGITEDDIAEAIDAAKAVGDDRIQQQSQGRVNPDQWTHGSSSERVAWFTKGYRSGLVRDCDTFAAGAL